MYTAHCQAWGWVPLTFHAPWEPGIECFLKVLLRHPAAQLTEASFGDGHCVSLLSGDDNSLAFNSGHIPGVSESQPAEKVRGIPSASYPFARTPLAHVRLFPVLQDTRTLAMILKYGS